jgi:hypothetical protein
MKLVRIGMVIVGILLVALAQAVRMYQAMRLEAGLPVSAYQSQVGEFLGSLAGATIIGSLGAGMLFFPEQIMPWFEEARGLKSPAVYPRFELFFLRLGGSILIIAALVWLWITGRFLIH